MTLGLALWASVQAAAASLVQGDGAMPSNGRTLLAGRMTHGGRAASAVASIGMAASGNGSGPGPVRQERAKVSSDLFMKISHGQHGTEAEANYKALRLVLIIRLVPTAMVIPRGGCFIHQGGEQRFVQAVQVPILPAVGQQGLLHPLFLDLMLWKVMLRARQNRCAASN